MPATLHATIRHIADISAERWVRDILRTLNRLHIDCHISDQNQPRTDRGLYTCPGLWPLSLGGCIHSAITGHLSRQRSVATTIREVLRGHANPSFRCASRTFLQINSASVLCFTQSTQLVESEQTSVSRQFGFSTNSWLFGRAEVFEGATEATAPER